MKEKTLILGLLLGILVLGLFLRLYQLDSENLWQDEGFTLMEVNKPTLGKTLQAVWGPPEGTPPFYFLLLHLWVKMAGSSDFSLRFPSVIFGIISIYLIFRVGKELFDSRTALVSSLLMSVSMLQILYSQEARAYSLMILLTLLSSLFFIKLTKKPGTKYFVGYFISTILLLYTHYFGLFVMLAHNLIYFLLYFGFKESWFKEKYSLDIKRWFKWNLLLGLLYIPGIILIFSQFQHNQRSLQSALMAKLGLPAFIAQLGIFNFLMPVLLLVLAVIFLYLRTYKKNNFVVVNHFFKKIISAIQKVIFNEQYFFLAVSIFSVLYVYLLPKLIHPFFATRFTIFLYPLFYLFLAYGLVHLEDKKLKKIIILIFLAVAISSLFFYYGSVKKPQWQEAVSVVEAEARSGELIIVLGQSKLALFNHYYRGGLEVVGVDIHLNQSENQEELNQLISRLKAGRHQGYWLIQSEAYKTQGIYKEYFENNFMVKSETKFYQAEVGHYG